MHLLRIEKGVQCNFGFYCLLISQAVSATAHFLACNSLCQKTVFWFDHLTIYNTALGNCHMQNKYSNPQGTYSVLDSKRYFCNRFKAPSFSVLLLLFFSYLQNPLPAFLPEIRQNSQSQLSCLKSDKIHNLIELSMQPKLPIN